MKAKINKLKVILKQLITTPQGWFSWFIANIITSLPWFLPLAYGFVFKDEKGYYVAGVVYAFILAPFTPFWILNILIAIPINKLLTKLVIKKNNLL